MRREESFRPGVMLAQTLTVGRKPDVDLQTSWRRGRAVELVRNARVGPGSDPGAGLLRFLLSHCELPE
jgi:hypothetical protein